MNYSLADGARKEGVTVPSLLLKKMSTMSEARLRVALCLCYSTTPMSIHQLDSELVGRYTPATIEKELHFLEGLGLIVSSGDTEKSPSKDIKDSPVKISRSDALLAAADNEDIRSLVRLAQEILGHTLSPGDVSLLATLVLCDGAPTEMLALAIAHCAFERDKPSIRYVNTMVKGWLQTGITTIADAERHLERRHKVAEYCKTTAALLDIPSDSVTFAESKLVERWFLEYDFNEAVVKEAVMHAGDKRKIRYINGILTRWHGEGKKTLKDIRAAYSGSNINPTPSKATAPKDDVMIKNRATVPTFKRRKDS